MTIKKVTKAAQVRNYVAKNPKAKPAEVAEAIGVGLQYVYTVLWNAKKKAGVKAKKTTLTLPKIKKGMAEHKKIMDETIKGWKTLSIHQAQRRAGKCFREPRSGQRQDLAGWSHQEQGYR